MLDVTVTDAKGRKSPRTIEIWQKGDDRRLVRMVAPPAWPVSGSWSAPEKTHLYLPQYPPAASSWAPSARMHSWGPTCHRRSLELTYADTYTATIGADEDGLTQLVLTHKTDPKAAPTHIWVDQDAAVHRVVHFDAKGSPARALEMADIRPVASAMLPHHIRVTDSKRGRVTEAHIQQIRVGSGIEDAMFSVTQLERR